MVYGAALDKVSQCITGNHEGILCTLVFSWERLVKSRKKYKELMLRGTT